MLVINLACHTLQAAQSRFAHHGIYQSHTRQRFTLPKPHWRNNTLHMTPFGVQFTYLYKSLARSTPLTLPMPPFGYVCTFGSCQNRTKKHVNSRSHTLQIHCQLYLRVQQLLIDSNMCHQAIFHWCCCNTFVPSLQDDQTGLDIRPPILSFCNRAIPTEVTEPKEPSIWDIPPCNNVVQEQSPRDLQSPITGKKPYLTIPEACSTCCVNKSRMDSFRCEIERRHTSADRKLQALSDAHGTEFDKAKRRAGMWKYALQEWNVAGSCLPGIANKEKTRARKLALQYFKMYCAASERIEKEMIIRTKRCEANRRGWGITNQYS